MGLFDKINSPVFLKDDSEAEKQLQILKELKPSLSGEALDKLEQEISRVEAGIIGEKQIRFELENSHMGMFVLHDLFLEHEGLTAQIDYVVITHCCAYIIECKNLYGNIEINSSGDFVRSINYKGRTIKEGIYSPITQNQRHLDLIKAIGMSNRGFLAKKLYASSFDSMYRSVVVLANSKTVLNDKYAKKEIKNQVIRLDQLIRYIKETDAKYGDNRNTDYTSKYKEMVEPPKCPMCGAPMILRTAQKGSNKGGQFYGCSNYPKCKGIRQI